MTNKLNVEIFEIESIYVDETKKWAGSMFIFDVLNNITNDEKNFFNINKWLFFDSDVLLLENTELVMQLFDKYEIGSYGLWSEFFSFNVWTESFHGVDLKKINKQVVPFGGEFLMLDNSIVQEFFNEFKTIYCKHKNYLLTEEHYYSLIITKMSQNNYSNIFVNPFLKRMFQANRNVYDRYLWCAHFPGQKDYKLKKIFKLLENNNFYYDVEKVKKIMGLGYIVNIYDIYNLKKIISKIANKIMLKVKK